MNEYHTGEPCSLVMVEASWYLGSERKKRHQKNRKELNSEEKEVGAQKGGEHQKKNTSRTYLVLSLELVESELQRPLPDVSLQHRE